MSNLNIDKINGIDVRELNSDNWNPKIVNLLDDNIGIIVHDSPPSEQEVVLAGVHFEQMQEKHTTAEAYFGVDGTYSMVLTINTEPVNSTLKYLMVNDVIYEPVVGSPINVEIKAGRNTFMSAMLGGSMEPEPKSFYPQQIYTFTNSNIIKTELLFINNKINNSLLQTIINSDARVSKNLSVFENNAEAVAGNLQKGQLYRTSDGHLMVVF